MLCQHSFIWCLSKKETSFLIKKMIYFTVTSELPLRVLILHIFILQTLARVCFVRYKKNQHYIFSLEIYHRNAVWSQVNYKLGIQSLKAGETQWIVKAALARIWYQKVECSQELLMSWDFSKNLTPRALLNSETSLPAAPVTRSLHQILLRVSATILCLLRVMTKCTSRPYLPLAFPPTANPPIPELLEIESWPAPGETVCLTVLAGHSWTKAKSKENDIFCVRLSLIVVKTQQNTAAKLKFWEIP